MFKISLTRSQYFLQSFITEFYDTVSMIIIKNYSSIEKLSPEQWFYNKLSLSLFEIHFKDKLKMLTYRPNLLKKYLITTFPIKNKSQSSTE